jgi:hypothetical protein
MQKTNAASNILNHAATYISLKILSILPSIADRFPLMIIDCVEHVLNNMLHKQRMPVFWLKVTPELKKIGVKLKKVCLIESVLNWMTF